MIRGRCRWRISGRRRVELGTGDVLLLPPQCLHGEEVPEGDEARVLWVGFAPGEPPAFFDALRERAWAAGPWAGDLAAVGDMLYREHQRPELPGSAARVEALLRVMLVTLQRIVSGAGDEPVAGRHGAALRAAANTLRKNLAQPPSVAQLARHHGLTPGHFSLLFSGAHGAPPGVFLRRARIEAAKERLRAGRETVKEIAAACGYAGAPHFCRLFKRATGFSPRAWRLRAGEGLPS